MAVVVLVVAGVGAFVGGRVSDSHLPSTKGNTRNTSASTTTRPGSLPRVINCAGARGPALKPAMFLVACGDGNVWVSGIAWTSWTDTAAHGRGTLNVNLCSPDCAQGSWRKTPTAIMLSKPVDTRYGPLYTTATVGALGTQVMKLPTNTGTPTSWAGYYLYIAPNSEDVALLALYQSAFGLTGTWYETSAHADSEAIALNGTETAMPPSNSFPVTVAKWGGGLQFEILTNYARVTLRATSRNAFGFTATKLVNGTPYSLTFEYFSSQTSAAALYGSEAQQIADFCQTASAGCGQN